MEQASDIRAVGAGIGLWPTAMRCLRRLGLEAVARDSIRVQEFEFRTASGRVLARADMADWLRQMAEPLRFVERGVLLRGLADALPPTTLRFGHEVRSVRSTGEGVLVDLADSSALAADVVVISGGVCARAVRGARVARGMRYSGATCWRGICPGAGIVPEGLCVIQFGSGRRFGINPLPGGRIYWWATKLTSPGGGEGDQKSELLRHFDGWGSGVPALIQATPAPAVRRDDLFDADQPGWGDDRTVAIGDAAHPILPTLGMAGTAAIEDAWVLADEMNRGPGVAQRVRERRTKRMHRLHRLSRIASRVGHARGAAAAVRNLILSAIPHRWVFQSAMELQRKEVTL